MSSLTLNIGTLPAKQKISIELDANRFERLAASFGFFNPAFLDSLDKAESDCRSGHVKKLSSLKNLRTS